MAWTGAETSTHCKALMVYSINKQIDVLNGEMSQIIKN